MSSEILITHESRIPTIGADVHHVIKNNSNGYKGFQEAYFSHIKFNCIKGWKRHNQMTLNLSVAYGKVKFVFYDNRESEGEFNELILSSEENLRVTIPPKIWVAFCGLHEEFSVLLNIADIQHDPDEIDRKDLSFFNYNWSL